MTPAALAQAVGTALGRRLSHVTVAGEGGAAIAPALHMADRVIERGEADACLVGGVDSLVNERDVARLRQAGRLLEPGTQGLIPGEGAAFVLVGPAAADRAVARICGAGTAVEPDHVLGARFSQGRGYAQALDAACTDGGVPESHLSFRVSTVNGEHYASWEAMFFSSRFYRTRRDHLPVWYTASGFGELGAASGVAAVVLAAFGIAGGYAPGPYAMVEAAAEPGLRAGCIVGPSPGAPLPPFRPDEGASLHILQAVRSSARS